MEKILFNIVVIVSTYVEKRSYHNWLCSFVAQSVAGSNELPL